MFSFKNCSIGRRVNGAIVITLFVAMAALGFAAHGRGGEQSDSEQRRSGQGSRIRVTHRFLLQQVIWPDGLRARLARPLTAVWPAQAFSLRGGNG